MPKKESRELDLLSAFLPHGKGIEMQEARGQVALAAEQCTLPKKAPWEDLEKLGFKRGEDQDDLFAYVTFPQGWKIKPTDHSMWSELQDDKGRKRGDIFYKAAFYDRSAHMYLATRLLIHSQYLNAALKERKLGDDAEPAALRFVVEKDGEVIYSSAAVGYRDWNAQDTANQTVKDWAKQNYPDYESTAAYWD